MGLAIKMTLQHTVHDIAASFFNTWIRILMRGCAYCPHCIEMYTDIQCHVDTHLIRAVGTAPNCPDTVWMFCERWCWWHSNNHYHATMVTVESRYLLNNFDFLAMTTLQWVWRRSASNNHGNSYPRCAITPVKQPSTVKVRASHIERPSRTWHIFPL